MVPFWFHFGSTLVPCWFQPLNVGSILVPCWFHFGSIWFHLGSMLVTCWFRVGFKFLVPRYWYPQKTETLRGGTSQKLNEGRAGAAGPPPRVLVGWKPPSNSRGSGGQQPPSKINCGDPVSDPVIWGERLKRVKPVRSLSDKVLERLSL